MTDNEVWRAVNKWLSAHTGVTVIKGWESGARPAPPYVMNNFTGSAEVRVHEQDTNYEEDEPSERVLAMPVIETEWRFSVHAYSGATPSDILRPLRSAQKLPQAQEPLIPGLIISELSPIRNVPDWQNERWEPRAQIDLNVRGLVRDGILIDTIEEITFEVNDRGDRTVLRP